ncbi:hypothetical protein F383_25108 [Gossypium arboreum]|uniref:Uncharacterized protein n=1 Tax=Gossypium arboreum TaxID=29729 RepID=A0A0B0P1K7_GOSAR|nr:hypothetical protein F383_25108 [Gossypium arboreum]
MCLSRVQHTVKLHGSGSPRVDFKLKSVCSTRSHTRACDMAMLHKSVYPTALARPSTRACDLAV